MSVVALAVAPVCDAEPPGPEGKDYPLAEGNYTTEADPGWIYFVVDFGGKSRDYHDYFGCGIGPDGTVGCDRVPNPGAYPSVFATYPPPGTNQTVATASGTGELPLLAHSHVLPRGRCAAGRPSVGERRREMSKDIRVRCPAGRASTASCSRPSGGTTGS